MIETRITCDLCGETIETDRTRLVLETGPAPLAWPVCRTTGRPALDLHRPCLDALAGWVAGRGSVARPGTPWPSPEKSGGAS